MNNIRIANDFIDQQDVDDVVKIIDSLMLSVERAGVGKSDDNRFVFFRPDDAKSVEVIKKYAQKVIESFDLGDVYFHDVIYAKSERGAEVDLHMDFESIDECNRCPYASVIYLNDDFQGGEIYFPKLDEKYAPVARSVAVFRQDDEKFVHGVRRVRKGHRYIINLCYTTDKDRQLDIYK